MYLHHLFAVIREESERRDVVDPEAFARYEALGVDPMAVYASKGEHERAVRVCAETLATAIASSSGRDQVVPSP